MVIRLNKIQGSFSDDAKEQSRQTAEFEREVQNTFDQVEVAVAEAAASGGGEKGDKGDKGDAGTAGADGTNGTNGTNGSPGTNGTDGTDGADGADAATPLWYQGADTVGGTTVAGTYVTLPLVDQISDTGFSNSSGEVTIATADRYEFHVDVTIDETSGGRTTSNCKLQRDGGTGTWVDVPGAQRRMYHRQPSDGETSASINMVLQVVAGEVFRLQGVRVSGSGVLSFLINGSSFMIRRNP